MIVIYIYIVYVSVVHVLPCVAVQRTPKQSERRGAMPRCSRSARWDPLREDETRRSGARWNRWKTASVLRTGEVLRALKAWNWNWKCIFYKQNSWSRDGCLTTKLGRASRPCDSLCCVDLSRRGDKLGSSLG